MHINILRLFSTIRILCFPSIHLHAFVLTTFSKHISLEERKTEVINFIISIRINIISDHNHLVSLFLGNCGTLSLYWPFYKVASPINCPMCVSVLPFIAMIWYLKKDVLLIYLPTANMLTLNFNFLCLQEYFLI